MKRQKAGKKGIKKQRAIQKLGKSHDKNDLEGLTNIKET